MSAALKIPELERGVVRLFSLSLPEDDAKSFGKDTAQIAKSLGLTELDGDHAQALRVRDLAGIGLANYLVDGMGVSESSIAADRTKLDALDGYVLAVASPAFDSAGATLSVKMPLTFVGSYAQPGDTVSFSALPSGSSQGSVSPPTSENETKGASNKWALALAMIVLGAGAFFVALSGNGP